LICTKLIIGCFLNEDRKWYSDHIFQLRADKDDGKAYEVEVFWAYRLSCFWLGFKVLV